MTIRSSRNLGDLCRQAQIKDAYRTLSVPQAMQEAGTDGKRKAYYIRVGREGARLFGVNGTSYLLAVPENVYEAIGMPKEGDEILLRAIFESFREQQKS